VIDLAWMAWTFLWLSFLAVGGGLGVLAEMRRQSVETFGWVTTQQFVDGYALCQLSPGPNMLVVVFIGYHAHGLLGAGVAGAAMFLPAAATASLAARYWTLLRERPWPRAIEQAILPVGIGLMMAGAWTLGRSSIHDVLTACIAVAAFGVLWRGWLPPIAVVLLGGAAGWLAGA
jgi:chromate transporter